MYVVLLARALAGPADFVTFDVTGMDDDCCAQKVATALDALPFLADAAASPALAAACVRVSGTFDEAAVTAALAHAGYGGGGFRPVEVCPEGLVAAPTDPWAGADGIDLLRVSEGETFEMKSVFTPGKFTIVDFGADWCAPCHEAARRITAYTREHPDVAVRTVHLAGADATASFAQPVVKQHMQWAQGLPYFLAFDPAGKPVYKGSDLDALLAAVDRKRK